MVRTSLVVTFFSIVLTACGGGGGGGTPSTISSASEQITPHNIYSTFATTAPLNGNFRLARIDYRFDTPSQSINANGLQTSSYEAVSATIDQIKSVGFSGVIFEMEAPINASTGNISFNDNPSQGTKTPPKALWKLVDYAKSQGLAVWLSLSISDSVTDCLLTPDFTKYTEQQLFTNIANYDVSLAQLAKQHNVDGLFVGEQVSNMESASHLPYWAYLINQIRTVFNGKLSYTSNLGADTPIWNYVDYPSIIMNGTLSNTPANDLISIVKMYFNDAFGKNEVDQIKAVYNNYGKKVILTEESMGADIGVNDIPPDFFNSMYTNFLVNATSTSDITYNGNLKSAKISAFHEILGLQLSNIVIGTSFSEFQPWLQDSSFATPDGVVYKYWCCGWEISNDLTEQKTLNTYFSQPWGYHTITLN